MASTRRRGEELAAAIRAATRAELADRGYPEVSFSGVAARARTSRPVLHRRYASRAHMVVDALLDVAFAPAFPPLTGSLREDLINGLTVAVAQYERIGLDTFRMLLAEADTAIRSQFMHRTQELVAAAFLPALEAAQARGELGPVPLRPRTLLLPVTLMRYEALMADTPPTRADMAGIVDDILLPLLRTVSRPATA